MACSLLIHICRTSLHSSHATMFGDAMMRSFKALLVALLLATPILTSCSESVDPTSTAPVVQPQDGLIGDLLGGLLGLVGSIITGPDANGARSEERRVG